MGKKIVIDYEEKTLFVEVFSKITFCEQCTGDTKGAWIVESHCAEVGLCANHLRESYDAVISINPPMVCQATMDNIDIYEKDV
jgi:hypothetical protein